MKYNTIRYSGICLALLAEVQHKMSKKELKLALIGT